MRRRMIGLILVLMAVTLTACGGLAGEPEIVGQLPPEQRAAQSVEVVVPDIEPNLLLGEQIFAEHCVRCHGITGAGDGELVLSGQVQNVPDFTDAATHEGKSADDYYRQVTLGNLEALMPPFADSLSDEERWAVANYVLTLAGTPSDVAAHTDTQAADSTVNTDTETDNSAAAHTDSQGGDSAADETATSSEENAAGIVGTISGTVTLVTEGATLPENLVATLYVFDSAMNEQSFETTINPDGSYQFNDVQIDAEHGYYVSVHYGEGFFNSDFLRGNPDNPDLQLDVTVYDVTDDPTVIKLNSVLTQVDALDGNTLRIWQMYTFVNTSDKLFATGAETGHQLSVRVPVPSNAVLADENDLSRYIYDDANGYVYDTYPVLPEEEHSFYLMYTLSNSSSLELNQVFDYEFVGSYQVYADQAVFDLKADGWTSLGQTQFNGLVYAGLGTSGNAQSLAISVNRRWFNFDKQTLGMILTVVGIVFIGIAALLFLKGQRSSATSPDEEDAIQILMKKIADLDDRFGAQEISKSAYEKQRAKLKAQLTELMKVE